MLWLLLLLINFEQIPEALQAGFSNVIEAAHHPVITLSWWEILTHPLKPGNQLVLEFFLFEWKHWTDWPAVLGPVPAVKTHLTDGQCQYCYGNTTWMAVSLFCRSIINFSRQCLDPGIRAKYFSPRLMEVLFCTVICLIHFLYVKEPFFLFWTWVYQFFLSCARFFVLYFIYFDIILNSLLMLTGCDLVLGQMGCNLFSTTWCE